METETTKICNKCKKEYPATSEYFYRDSHKNDGLRPSCRKCYTKYQTKYNKGYEKKLHTAINKNITLDKNWQDDTVVQKFKKLYLEDLLPVYKICEKTKLSISNIQFLIEELDIKISRKQRFKMIKEKKDRYFISIRPSKKDLESKYEEASFSMQRLKEQYPKIPLYILNRWFDELGIQRRWALRFQNREQRLQNIIKQLKKKI